MKITAAFILVLLLIISLDWSDVLLRLSIFQWVYFTAAVGLNIVGVAISSEKLRQILNFHSCRLNFFYISRIYMMGAFFNNFLPGAIGGDVLKYFYLVRKSCGRKAVLVSIFLERASGLAVIVTGAWFMLWIYSANLPVPYLKIILFLSLGLICTVIVLYFRASAGAVSYLAQKESAQRWLGKLLAMNELIREALRYPRLMIHMLFWSVLFQINILFIYHMFALGFGLDLRLFEIVLSSLLIQLITMLPLSINGIGIREWSFIYLFGLFGISAETATAFSLAIMLSTLTASLMGGVLYALDRDHPPASSMGSDA